MHFNANKLLMNMEKAPVGTCVEALYVRFIRALHLRIKYAKRKGQKK